MAAKAETPGAPNTPAAGTETKVEAPIVETKVETKVETPKPGDGQAKPGEEVKPPVEKVKEPAAAATGAPEKYTLVIPETAKSWVDDKDIARVAAIAKANNWTNAEAQEYVEQIADTAIEQSTQMLTEFKSDKTYGGEHAEETQRFANLALDRVRPKDHQLSAATRSMLLKTGYGNNLLVISLLADFGRMMAEDSATIPTTGGIDANTPMHERIYGKTKTS